MERSKRDLEALVSSQKEQLLRYEKRLKDVVTAYKGLLKEKDALETSLNALTISKETVNVAEKSNDLTVENVENITITTNEDKDNLQTQIMTLMNSLATLSAEKSRMEASFQADKKQLRQQLSQKEQKIMELQQQQKLKEDNAKLEVEEMRAKWIIERQEREKETNNQMLMIRELQKLYADERHLKENIEMQLNNFKTQFASTESEHGRLNELQQQLHVANMKLQQLHDVDKQIAANADNTMLLQQLQQEMQHLKQQHAIALKNEQKRVLLAEEQSRQQAALYEERVTNLEARLAELSNSVGKYDRLRQLDQQNIQVLKQQLQDFEKNDIIEEPKQANILPQHDIVEQILRLKKLLLQENSHATQPLDMANIFAMHTDHVQCQEELSLLQQQYDTSKIELTRVQELLDIQKAHIGTLQEKVMVLNRNIDEQETELKRQSDSRQQAVKEERAKWQQKLNEKENEYRSKLNDLEQQLQKQRQRSLQLLDDKEQEIRALQNSFEILHGNQIYNLNTITDNNVGHNTQLSASSDNESIDESAQQHRSGINSKKLSLGENIPMLHYANEIARKEKEISILRKAKFSSDSALRTAIQEKVAAQEHLNNRIEDLEEQVDRFQRCVSREGANLEYLKNVIISFIVTRDAEGKRHMLNAISAVLQFTPIEIQTINAVFFKK